MVEMLQVETQASMLKYNAKDVLAEKEHVGMQAQAALSGQLVVARQQHADVCLQAAEGPCSSAASSFARTCTAKGDWALHHCSLITHELTLIQHDVADGSAAQVACMRSPATHADASANASASATY